MQALVTYAIVAIAAAYAAWVLMPAAARRHLLGWARSRLPSGAQPLIGKLDAGEPGCSSCKACATDARAPEAAALKTVELRRR